MKKGSLSVRMLVLLSLLALAAACGGGGGGGGGGSTPLATGLFTKTTATISTATGGLMDTNAYTHYQNLYLASTIKGAGKITGIAYKYPATLATAMTCTSTTIKLGHSSLAANTTTFANNVSNGKGGQTTVLENGTMTFPADAADTWHTITFTTPFDYNGVDNLVVDVERSAACVGGDYPDAVAYGAYNATTWSFTPASATGAVGTWIANTKFTFSGGENKQEYGGTNSNSWPFSANGSPTIGAPLRTQNLYLASNIQGSGPITGIGFQMNATSVEGTYTYSLTLGHSTLSALTATFASNYSSTPVTVASAVTFTIPAGIPAGEWIWVPIPGSVFTYNGVDNLIVSVATTSGSADNDLRTTTIAGSRVWGDSDTAATGTVSNSEYNLALRFNGGTMDLITPENGNSYFLGTSAVSQQVLYRTAELGTKGAINKIACRAQATYPARAYANTQVVMVRTTDATLSATYADNITGGSTVFSGTLNIPAVTQGDWIEIPLSSAFSYDGTSNLVIQLSSDGGPANEWCYMGADAARWPSRTFQSGFSPVNAVYDMRFWVQK